MNILDIFYNEIIKEASCGKIETYFTYNIIFSTKIVDNYIYVATNEDLLVPTLYINDKEKFDSLLVEYVEIAKSFYKDSSHFEGTDEKNIVKTIMALLFSNATIEDFNNPCAFLQKRIDFINNTEEFSSNLGYSDILSANLKAKIEKDKVYNETPYQFTLEAEDESNNKFYFPHIKFGISEGTLYIYAIQNGKEKSNSKKVSRALYKIGEGFDSKEDNFEKYEEGNLMDITSSFLVAINILISYYYNKGINKIEVPSILIERWNAKEIANQRRLDLNIINSETYDNNKDSHIEIQRNLTEKLIRTFLRLKQHYPNIEINSLPMENDSTLKISINNLEECNNKLLDETKNIISPNKMKLR